MNPSSPSNAGTLVERCMQLRADALPEGVRHEARRALLDTLGCILLGAGESRLTFPHPPPASDPANTATAFLKQTAKSTSAREAMVHNARMAQVHDANDGHTLAASRKSCGHPGRFVVPAALAEAQAGKLSLGELLCAIVAGYEFACRALPAVPALNLDALGPVAALARLRNLPTEMALTAAGLALPLTPQTLALGWASQTHHNFLRCGTATAAAWDALAAAECDLCGPDLASPDALRLLDFETVEVDSPFALMGRYTKPYPSCRMTHGAIECALELLSREKLDPTHIRRIAAWVVPGGLYVKGTTLHDDFKRRAFSLPVCVAASLHFGGLTPTILGGPMSATIADLASRTTVYEDPAFTAIYPDKGRPTRLRLTLDDGTTHEHQINVPLGEPGNRETDQSLLKRFIAYGQPSIPARQLETAGQWILEGPLDQQIDRLFKKLLST